MKELPRKSHWLKVSNSTNEHVICSLNLQWLRRNKNKGITSISVKTFLWSSFSKTNFDTTIYPCFQAPNLGLLPFLLLDLPFLHFSFTFSAFLIPFHPYSRHLSRLCAGPRDQFSLIHTLVSSPLTVTSQQPESSSNSLGQVNFLAIL